MIAWPYNWVAMAVASLLLAIGGFTVGIEWEQGREAKRVVADKIHVIEHTKTVLVADNKALAASQKRAEGLAAENESLQAEVRNHAASLPDPVDCHFHASRVLTIRRAWGSVGPNPPADKGLVPGPDARPVSRVGEPERSGSVGRALGPQVSVLP